jgi:hypothetical protein
VSRDDSNVFLAQLVALFEIDEAEYAMRVVVGEMVVFAFGGGGVLKKREDKHIQTD